MSPLKLVLGNKNYSSWSLRPWIAMKVNDIPFEEIQLQLDFEVGNRHLLEYSPSQRVPALHHGDLIIWESLAILEYVAELNPQKNLWPTDPSKRALARSIACEMHAGFGAIRAECPMNMRREPRSILVSEGVLNDVKRIEAIWRERLDDSQGPFLFGKFSNADAMFAPVVNRLLTYQLASDKSALTYCATMTALPAWKEWEAAARAEPWTIESEEF